MSETALLIRNDSRREIAFTDQAQAIKTAALEKSALIAKVETPEQQETAVEAQRDLATLAKNVEAARKAAKEPILAFGKLIDDQAKSFVKDIADEQMRIAALVGSYQQLQAAKAAAEERARRLEAERIERERQAELRRIQEEADTAARVIREQEQAALRAAQEASNAKERAKAEELAREIARQRELAAAANHAALDAANEKFSNESKAHSEANPIAAPVRAEGQRVVTEWEVEVTDIWTLARVHPTCVNLEPRMSEIKALLNMGVEVKGVRASKKIKSNVTARRLPAAIEA
jgi:hypothetical protein